MTPTIGILDGKRGNELLRRHCESANVPPEAVLGLVRLEHEHVGSGRRHTIFVEIDELLSRFAEVTNASR